MLGLVPHSHACTNQDEGSAVSLNATIVQGRDKGCDKCGGVYCGRFYLSCKSGDQCVYKDDICNAMEMNQCVRFWSCNGWSRIWRWHLSSTLLYSKCPAAYVPTNHLCEMLIISDSDAFNPKYDCLSRVRLNMGTAISCVGQMMGVSHCSCIDNQDHNLQFT